MANILAGGLAALWLAAAPVNAADLSAMQGESISVGAYHGVVYFTAEADGHRVVATLADSDSGAPLRFSTTLADQQSATLSVPGAMGKDASSLKFLRFGDKVVIETDSTGAERSTAGVVTQ